MLQTGLTFFNCNLSGKHFLDGPSTIQPRVEGDFLDAQICRPVRDALCFAVIGEQPIVALVARLFCGSCPAHITRNVALHVVNAVKRVSILFAMREAGNILAESREVLPPFWGNCNSPRTIIFVVLSRWIVAALRHGIPSSAKRMIVDVMRSVLFDLHIFPEASARLNFSRPQRNSVNDRLIATVAFAQPAHMTMPIDTYGANRHQLAKSLIGDVFGVGVEGDKMGLHKNLPFLCQAWDVCRVARHFVLVFYSFILAQVSEQNKARCA